MSKMYNVIQELCRLNGISVGKMCKELSITRSCLSELNSGRTEKLSVENTNKIANYFNVSVEYLMGEANQKNKPLVNNDEELTEYLDELKNRKEMRMLFSVSKGCTKEEVEQAVRIIEALRKNGDD